MSEHAKVSSKRGFTPRAWKVIAVAYSFVTFLDNLGEAGDWWSWIHTGVAALAFLVLLCVGHRPPRRLS